MAKRPREADGVQYVEEKSETEKIVHCSPYGAGRAALGWGTPFARCQKAAVADHSRIRIGTSSLNSVVAKNRDMAQLLQQYRKKFSVLEHCNPYYRVGEPENWVHWHDMVHRPCPEFVFTIKANRYLTHDCNLAMSADVETHVRHFFAERCPLLREHLGPVLLQLPPSFKCSPDHLERLKVLATAIPSGARVAVEFRHASWFGEETYAVLRALRWALVFTHNEDSGESPFVDTGAGFMYARMHGALGRFIGDYGPETVERFASIVAAYVEKHPTADVFFFFNNNESSAAGLTSAVADATALANALTKRLAKTQGTDAAVVNSINNAAADPAPKPVASIPAKSDEAIEIID